ncbi:hypothetical protein GPECTOR_68g385 [Gonium pectorale]|uniref:Peptidase M11 gametolysin domain-containing protein n=1 Tax=Gonium pectorale TaxID=33097 RepID=A0A150G3M0_GONPE|nr:hypothetical protein GPECTOR_68g385 [Gonium pectorale]|eukprot:KXZ44413.1 hypothetical protein GPECTOR_68g385 [Gonium pectorale]
MGFGANGLQPTEMSIGGMGRPASHLHRLFLSLSVVVLLAGASSGQAGGALEGQGVEKTFEIVDLRRDSLLGATRRMAQQAANVSVLPQSVGANIRILVSVLRVVGNCSFDSGLNVGQVRDFYLRSGGHADRLEACSYGQMKIDRTRLRVIETNVTCNSFITRFCTYPVEPPWSDAVTAALQAQLGDDYATGYDHLSFTIPTTMRSSRCALPPAQGHYPLAFNRPGFLSMYLSTLVVQSRVAIHEILHNYGLYHAYGIVDNRFVEYGDNSTLMGYADACPSAPELYRLRWASPLAWLSGTDLAPEGVMVDYRLPATYLTNKGSMLIIQPDWLGDGYTENVFVSFRARGGGDANLQDTFVNKVSIHNTDKDEDRFKGWDDASGTRFRIRAVLGEGQTFIIPAGKDDPFDVIIFVKDVIEGSAAVVSVCKYPAGSDPLYCLGYPPPLPPSPSPPPPPPPPRPIVFINFARQPGVKAYLSTENMAGKTPLTGRYCIDGVTSYSGPVSGQTPWICHTATKGDRTPWLSLDLGKVYAISHVVIFTRCDCCADSLSNAELRIGNTSVTTKKDARRVAGNPAVWAQGSPMGLCSSVTVPFSTWRYGRWVTLQNRNNQCVMTACALQITELQVFGPEHLMDASYNVPG